MSAEQRIQGRVCRMPMPCRVCQLFGSAGSCVKPESVRVLPLDMSRTGVVLRLYSKQSCIILR